MAKIFYGVQGDGAGHVNRARVVAEELIGHEFLFLGGGTAQELAATGHRVVVVPAFYTAYRRNRVDPWLTARHALATLCRRQRYLRTAIDEMRRFDPDLILSDYEHFTPLAARVLGRPCVSLDHQHFMTHCRYVRPPGQWLAECMAKAAIRCLFNRAHRFLIVSFFSVTPRDPRRTEVFPPILRREIRARSPANGSHALVYQTSATFRDLLPVLERMDTPFFVYGMGQEPHRANLTFRAPSAERFIEDLAACRYAIVNGGHNVICEAICLGKPVYCFPIADHYEQVVNAHSVARLGYGEYSTARRPSLPALLSFEARLEHYRANIGRGLPCGNAQLKARLESLIRTR